MKLKNQLKVPQITFGKAEVGSSSLPIGSPDNQVLTDFHSSPKLDNTELLLNYDCFFSFNFLDRFIVSQTFIYIYIKGEKVIYFEICRPILIP